jgi:hypothetical protein
MSELQQDHNPVQLRANPRVIKRAVRYDPPKRAQHTPWPQPTQPTGEATEVLM